MFALPLSVRERLSLVPIEVPFKTDLLIHNNNLCVLILTPTYLELLLIPLDGSPEQYEIKAIAPLDGCLSVENGVLCVYTLHKNGIYAFKQNLSDFYAINFKLEKAKIKSCNGQTVLLSNSTFYKVEDNLKKLSISPYFDPVLSFDLTVTDDTVLIVYKTKDYVSVYTTEGEAILRRFKTNKNVFVNGNKLLVEDNKDLLVYKLTKACAELHKRINLQLEGMSMARVCGPSLAVSGESSTGFYFYIDGVVYNVSSLIFSLVEFKQNYFCSSRDAIYFIPKACQVPIKLTGTEKMAIENILKGVYSPFVARTFNYNQDRMISLVEREEEALVELNEKCHFVSNRKGGINKVPEGIVKWVDPKGGACPGPRNGIFLSLLAWQAFKSQCCRTICNTLNALKKTGKGAAFLSLLYAFTKLSPKAYKAFISLRIDFDRLYTQLYTILDEFVIDKNLLLACLEFSFFPVNFPFLGRQNEVYEGLRGVERYKKGLWLVEGGVVNPKLNPFFIRVLKANEDFIGLFFLYKDCRGLCTAFPSLVTGPPSLPPFETLKDFLKEIKNYKKEKAIEGDWNKQEAVDFIGKLTDRQWLVAFVEGNFEPLEGFNAEVYKECTTNPLYVQQGLKYLSKRGDFKRLARLLYYAHKRGIKVDKEYFNEVGDYVFVEDNQFVDVRMLRVF